MAEIINDFKNKDQVREAARKIVKAAQTEDIKNNLIAKNAIQEIIERNPMFSGMEDLAALINLPEEHFAMLSPAFFEEIERSFNNINNQLILVKAINLSGMAAEDIEEEYKELCKHLDEGIGISVQKTDFLKNLLGLTYNAVLKAEGIAKRKITIPIEYCHNDAKMPAYAHITDAGMDIYAVEDITINPGETKLIPTGLKVAIPAGFELQVRPKSGRCLKTKLRIANAPGTIDAGYRDEIGVIIDNIDPVIRKADIDENGRLYNVEFGSSYTIEKGEKFAQLVLAEVPKAIFYEVASVMEVANDGRNGGFGSTGVK